MSKDDEAAARPGPPSAPARPGRGLRIALILSVAVNLAIGGLVAGAYLHGPPGPPMAVRDLGFGPFAAALSDADRRALREAFFRRGPDPRSARRAMMADVQAVAAALRADPFVPDTLRAALDSGAKRTVELLTVGQGLLFDHVVAMDPAARKALADRLDEMLARRGPEKERGGPPDGP